MKRAISWRVEVQVVALLSRSAICSGGYFGLCCNPFTELCQFKKPIIWCPVRTLVCFSLDGDELVLVVVPPRCYCACCSTRVLSLLQRRKPCASVFSHLLEKGRDIERCSWYPVADPTFHIHRHSYTCSWLVTLTIWGSGYSLASLDQGEGR